jgi:uncharacterized protein YndB with AHSA1/START domain/DNA-binding transcriptional ArsR family regulator
MTEELDPVFRALADPNRRLLLDRLFEADGQPLGRLIVGLPMSRFGGMKHLRVLAEAGLVTTRRVGREKRHYLNPVPIRLIHDRWVSKYAEPWVGALSVLKAGLEGTTMANGPKHVYEVYIRTTPERLWQAITDPAMTQRYYYGTTVESDWRPGAPMTYREADGHATIVGEVLEVDRPRRLVTTFSFPAGETASDRPSRVTWEISQMGDACLLVLTHDDFDGETATYRSVEHGWVPILSGLKTLLETGEPLLIAFPEPVNA